jgi:integrase
MSTRQQVESSEKATVRSLPIEFWPEADRKAWVTACQPSQRLRRGGAGSHMKPITLNDLARRYGYFLDCSRAELVAAARMAVRTGTPIESLTSLAALLDPDVVEPVINAYWEKNGKKPKVYTIDLGWKLLSLARQVGLDGAAIERLDDIRAALEEHRHGGLTGKNLTLIRQVLTEGIWSEVVSLPNVLMRQARADQPHAPVKAAVTAQLAVAIAILSVAPVRLTNLVSIKLEENLIKPGGPNSSFWLVFPHYDVKNRVNLEFTFDEALTGLIDEYIHDFRPTLLRRSNAAWLFPGVAGEPKTANMFSTQITERIQKATGVRTTVHQFRHACAAIYLKHRPGEYETVRRLLGHRNIQTTINFYCGLETTPLGQPRGASYPEAGR